MIARRTLVFARAPVPGACKTRLIPMLGAQGAARLQRQLTRQTLQCALAANTAVELWCAPSVRHPFFVECRMHLGLTLRRQADGDLGARMASALSRALRDGAAAAVIVGTDCAALTPADLVAAFDALEAGDDYVLQPAVDGGFVLIGARVDDPQVLRDVDWSSGRELAQTRSRIVGRGHRLALLPERWDIDHPADLRRARAEGLLAA